MKSVGHVSFFGRNQNDYGFKNSKTKLKVKKKKRKKNSPQNIRKHSIENKRLIRNFWAGGGGVGDDFMGGME